MSDGKAAELAAKCHRALDPLHSLIYFAPEADEKLAGIGLKPGRMTYFASRSAPMGPVGAGVVTATFYNFNPDLVARHIPKAWGLASPDTILATRLDVVDATLRRLLGDAVDSPEVAEAAELAREATAGCAPHGRPLYAAHAELDWPEQPHLALWHGITLLREFRGDGHIAALTTQGVDGLAALITHSASGKGFTETAAKATRGWSDEQWAAGVERLREQGILDGNGELTADGVALRERVEAATDAAATAPYIHLGEEKCLRLREIGKSLSRTVVAAGAFPATMFGK
ncbi:SCO6745 family protein [Haloechinothrix halophila]|uniref:SCO6745 family protein n=1 Tax=Haloechinothrix halophila TaxID=1069073 RepID=UPI000402F962|nr:hypothetical protein [Haloechinothrix halophila]